MDMVAETRRKLSAVLFIAMLAAKEAQHVRWHGRSRFGSKLKPGTSAANASSSVGATSAVRTIVLDVSTADQNTRKPWDEVLMVQVIDGGGAKVGQEVRKNAHHTRVKRSDGEIDTPWEDFASEAQKSQTQRDSLIDKLANNLVDKLIDLDFRVSPLLQEVRRGTNSIGNVEIDEEDVLVSLLDSQRVRDIGNTSLAHSSSPKATSVTLTTRQALSQILEVAIPNIWMMILTLLTEVINMMFITHTEGHAAVAAVGLGNMMQNCLGLSIGIGLTTALDTLVSQAFGAGQKSLSWVYVQRGRVVVTLQLVWMIPMLMFSYQWLSLLHEPHAVSLDAGKYNRAAVFGLVGFFQYEANAVYLRNTGYPNVPTAIIGITTILHFVWASLFIGHWRLGNRGAGLANMLTWWEMCLLSFAYLLHQAPILGLVRRSVLKISRSAFQGWKDYMTLAIPSTLQMCSDWWLWEFIAILVGWLGAEVQAAHNSAANFQSVAFMPAIGISISASTLVGTSLGENRPKKSRQFVWLCVALSQISWLLVGGASFLARHQLVNLYFPSAAEQTSRDIANGIVCFCVLLGFPASAQQAMAGVMRGMGKQKVATVVYLFSNWVLSLPLMLVLAFPMRMGIWGVWSGMIAGPTVALICFLVYLHRCNFEDLAFVVSENMRQEGQLLESSQNSPPNTLGIVFPERRTSCSEVFRTSLELNSMYHDPKSSPANSRI